jgi:hypothetical protein
VPIGREEVLEEAMKSAFEAVTGVRGVKLKEETERPADIIDRWDRKKSFDRRNPSLSTLMASEVTQRIDPPRSPRYSSQLEQFRRWSDSRGALHGGF